MHTIVPCNERIDNIWFRIFHTIQKSVKTKRKTHCFIVQLCLLFHIALQDCASARTWEGRLYKELPRKKI